MIKAQGDFWFGAMEICNFVRLVKHEEFQDALKKLLASAEDVKFELDLADFESRKLIGVKADGALIGLLPEEAAELIAPLIEGKKKLVVGIHKLLRDERNFLVPVIRLDREGGGEAIPTDAQFRGAAQGFGCRPTPGCGPEHDL